MSQASPASPKPAVSPAGNLPAVRLEVRAGASASTSYTVGETGFLLGSVPGCDLRLPGSNLPPVLALIARQPGGATLRKLAPIAGLLLNGEPVGTTSLQDGDRISVGSVDIGVSVATPPAVPVMHVQLYDEQRDELHRRAAEQTEQREADRVLWERRRQEFDEECQRRSEEIAAREAELREDERRLQSAHAMLEQHEQEQKESEAGLAAQRHELGERMKKLAQERADLDIVRSELLALREQLLERYRERRDKLIAQQEAVRRAARRLQEEKQQFDEELKEARELRSMQGAGESEITARAEEIARKGQTLQQLQDQLREREKELQAEYTRKSADLAGRERKLEEEREALRKSQAQHQTDLVRLDRLAATLEQRQRQIQKQALEVDRRFEGLQRHTRELEEQATQLDEWNARLTKANEETEQAKQELEATRIELAQRTSALEGQQAMLATLRARLERLRDDHRRQEQQLAEQRSQQDAAEVEIRQRLADARRLTQEMEAEKNLNDEQQKQFDERRATMETAVAQLREARDRLADEEGELQRRKTALEAALSEQQEEGALLQARALQLEEHRQRLVEDRKAIAERESVQVRAEQVIATLQEQLRKRAEELSVRQKAQDEQARQFDELRTTLAFERDGLQAVRQQSESELTALRDALDKRAAELEERQAVIARQEEEFRGGLEELGQARQLLDQEGAALAAERERTAEEKRRIEAESAKAQAIIAELPALEERATLAVERLGQSREQLRGHLAEVHAYARQSRDDLEVLRNTLRGEQKQLAQQEQALLRRQDEHRLAVAAFRQEMLDWQARLAEMKQVLALGETQLERRQAEVEKKATQIAATTQKLAEQAEHLQQQEREVAERREEVHRHLADMREWYRRKLRELARNGEEIDLPEHPPEVEPGTGGEGRPDILTLTSEIDPGDRQLGELLRSMELVDADTLTALLVEARRQRRSLRQLLLAGNYLTLFQMALIEAGNLNGLVLGPVRVIDKLHSTPREGVYRVFDPRGNREALLRHLAESEMGDPVRPDEFRQRFGAAAGLSHPHLAATYEVLEIGGRPAVLQEWLTGLPSTEWPALATVPGVCYRLLSQAALGLHAAHQSGLVHGNLYAGQVVFSTEGMLKLCGFGEPNWLALPPPPDDTPGDVASDLLALGRCARAWLNLEEMRKGSRSKPPPKSLQDLLRRLCGEEGEPFVDGAELLQALESISGDVAPNPTAWERFVKQVREQSADSPLRRSA